MPLICFGVWHCGTALSNRRWLVGLLLCLASNTALANWELITGIAAVPVPAVLAMLAVLIFCVHQVVKLNHQLRTEVRNRWQAEDALQDSQHRLELALWGADIGCWDWNLDVDEVFLDRRSAQLLDLTAGECILNLHDSHPACDFFRNLRPKILRVEGGMQLQQGFQFGERWLQFTGKRLSHENTSFRALGTLMDISQAHAYQEKLEELSITDALTGVMNRRHFLERLVTACNQAVRDGSPLAVAMLDIDHFKAVNDRYGHLVGDDVLGHFASLLKRSCRPYDLVARFGGEEFIILFVGIDRGQAQEVLGRYRLALQQAPLKVPDGDYVCRFSAGIADLNEVVEPDTDYRGLVSIADQRLYQAKHQGRDRILTGDESP